MHPRPLPVTATQAELEQLKKRVVVLEERLAGVERRLTQDTPVAAATIAAERPIPQTASTKPPLMDIWNASSKGKVEALRQHIAAGTDLSVGNNLGQTPLHLAAANNHADALNLLIENGAEVNKPDTNGDTPLDWAVSFQRTEMADLLRKNGGRQSPKEEGTSQGESTKTP